MEVRGRRREMRNGRWGNERETELGDWKMMSGTGKNLREQNMKNRSVFSFYFGQRPWFEAFCTQLCGIEILRN